jgi:hypothetical protein
MKSRIYCVLFVNEIIMGVYNDICDVRHMLERGRHGNGWRDSQRLPYTRYLKYK